MNRQGNVLNKKQYAGAPIERAHLHRGFKAKKTPIKWIRFFRACVLQREVAEKRKKTKLRKMWIAFACVFAGSFLVGFLTPILPFMGFVAAFLFLSIFPFLIIACIINYRTNKKFRKTFTDGFDFFADYFSAFFTLIEEDLKPQSKISLDANLKETKTEEYLLRKEEYNTASAGFISGDQNFYERIISKGSCLFNDGSLVSFQFAERARERIIKKRGSSGKTKWKHKNKSVYPFTLRMKIPKAIYNLNPSVNKENINLVEEGDFYIFKAVRKFDTQKERPDQYNPYEDGSITTFAVDYFSLEVINLINTCYSCVKPRA